MKIRGYAVTVKARKLYFVIRQLAESRAGAIYPTWEIPKEDFFMPTLQRRIVLTIISGVLFAGIVVSMIVFSQQSTVKPEVSNSSVITEKSQDSATDTISYTGRTGVDALTLLEEKGTVEKTSAGFVSAINGRKADEGKREYWSFYVNGKPATVGASEYRTQDTDKIEWKIETY